MRIGDGRNENGFWLEPERLGEWKITRREMDMDLTLILLGFRSWPTQQAPPVSQKLQASRWPRQQDTYRR